MRKEAGCEKQNFMLSGEADFKKWKSPYNRNFTQVRVKRK